jgi:hypothetical protein
VREKRLTIGGAAASINARLRTEQPNTTKPIGDAKKTGVVDAPSSTGTTTTGTTTDQISSTPLIPSGQKKDVLSAQQATALVKELARSFDCTDERQLIRRLTTLTDIADIAPALPGGIGALGVPVADGIAPFQVRGTDVEGIAPGSVKAALVNAFGPLGDLIYGANADSLIKRANEVKETATNVKQFRAELGDAKNLDALLAVADTWRDQPLPAQCKNELMKAMMNQASGKDTKPFEAAAAWYKDSVARHPAHAADEIGREFYIVCLNKAGRLEDSLVEARSYIASMTGGSFVPSLDVVRKAPQVNGEVLAGLGKAFKLVEESIKKGAPLSDTLKKAIETELGFEDGKVPVGFDYAKAALEISTRYYEAGFAQDFEYYPGIVSVYNNYEQGDAERAERLAPMVWQSCERAGGKEAKDYWCLSTQTELSLILNKNADLLELLPRMLGRADVGWMLSSTVSKMSTLAASRDAAGQDTRALHHVIDALNARVEALDAHAQAKKAPNADGKALDAAFAQTTTAWINQTTAALREKLGARDTGHVDEKAAAAAAITQKVLTSTADFRSLTSSHAVGGNVAYGGQIPDMTITRHSVRVVRELLQSWGLDKTDDVNEFNKVVNDKLNVMLGLQVEHGRRPLEDLHSEEHHVLDRYDKNRFKLAATDVSGDTRTDLLAILTLGIGDCRPTAYAKQLLFDVWQHDAVNQKLGAALHASTRGDKKTYEKKLGEADLLQRTMLRTVTVLIEAPVQMKQMYEWITDGDGRPMRDPKGAYNKVENHTFNILVELDKDGNVKENVRAADAFYQELYPLGSLPLSASGLVKGGVWQHDTMGTKAHDGNDIPFRMTPASHSGSLLKAFDVGSCDFRFCGQNIAPPTFASLAQERGRLNALAQGIAGLEM